MRNVRLTCTMPAIPQIVWFGVPSLVSVLVLSTACSGGSSTPAPSANAISSSPTPGGSGSPASPSAFGWRESEYAKVGRLRGGMTLDYFRDVLGTPMVVSKCTDG